MGIPWRFARDYGWRLRQEIIWAKPNYTPEKVRDRQNNYLFASIANRAAKTQVGCVPISSYKGAHFATFPPAEPCILAGSRVVFMGSGTTAAVAVKHGRKYLDSMRIIGRCRRIQSEVLNV